MPGEPMTDTRYRTPAHRTPARGVPTFTRAAFLYVMLSRYPRTETPSRMTSCRTPARGVPTFSPPAFLYVMLSRYLRSGRPHTGRPHAGHPPAGRPLIQTFPIPGDHVPDTRKGCPYIFQIGQPCAGRPRGSTLHFPRPASLHIM